MQILFSSKQQMPKQAAKSSCYEKYVPNPANHLKNGKSITSQAHPAKFINESSGHLFYMELTLTRIQASPLSHYFRFVTQGRCDKG